MRLSLERKGNMKKAENRILLALSLFMGILLGFAYIDSISDVRKIESSAQTTDQKLDRVEARLHEFEARLSRLEQRLSQEPHVGRH